MFEKELLNFLLLALKEHNYNTISNLDMRMKTGKIKDSKFWLKTNTNQFQIGIQVTESIFNLNHIPFLWLKGKIYKIEKIKHK